MQGDNGGGGGMGVVGSIIYLAIIAAMIAGMWKTFEKAGEPGWAAIVPIYNIITLLKIAGKPIWWIVLLIIPCANIVVMVLTSIAVAEKFGKGTGFGIGLGLLSPVFYPILGFGDATYQGAPAAPR